MYSLSVCLLSFSVSLSVYLSLSVSVSVSISLSLSVRSSVCPSVCLSVCPHTSSLSTAELYAKINTDLTQVRDWLLANKLSLNVTKTEFIFLTTDFKLSNLGKYFSIKIGNNRVKRVKTTKYLGIHLDENLKWNEHVNKLLLKSK